jgi:hypothetical protein
MRQTRKSFLALAAAALAAAALPTAGAFKRLTGGQATAAPGGRVLERFTERGRAVEIRDLGGTHVLRLNGRTEGQHVFMHLGRGRYSSHHLPFGDPQGARGLVRQLLEGEDLQLFVL